MIYKCVLKREVAYNVSQNLGLKPRKITICNAHNKPSYLYIFLHVRIVFQVNTIIAQVQMNIYFIKMVGSIQEGKS